MSERRQVPHLLDELPIIVYPSLAVLLGSVNEAIVLQQLHFLMNSAKTSKNTYVFIDEHWWVYNSYKQWRDHFPWLAEITIKTLFADLEKRGIVISRQGVKDRRDRRKWYTIDYAVFEAFVTLASSDKKYPFHGIENISSNGQKISDDSSETASETTSEKNAPSGAAAKAEKPNTKGKEKAASAKAVSKWTLRECAAFEEGCSAALAALRATFGHDTDMTRFKDMTVLEQRAFIGTYQELERVGVTSTDYAALVAFARKDWPKLPVSQLPKYVTDWRQASKPKTARKYAGETTTEPKTSKPEETPEERAQRLAQFRAMRPASIGGAS